MKIFTLFLAPLIAISFLTNCNSGPKLYTVTFDTDGGEGTIRPQTVIENHYATKPVDPSKDTPEATYTFAYWELDNREFIFDTPITKDITLKARWNKVKTKKYNVTLSSAPIEGGVVEGAGIYECSSNVTITANTKEGYIFVGWYEGKNFISNKSSYTFKMPTNDVSYTAKFTANEYNITVTSEDELKGTVTGGGTYEYNSNVTIIATAKIGYKFIGWYEGEDFISNKSSYTFKMPAENIIYTAKFIAFKHKLTVTSEDELKGTVTGVGTYEYNSKVTITATPINGYAFVGWYDGDSQASLLNPFTFAMPNNDVSYVAKFDNPNAWYHKTDWWNYCSSNVSEERAIKSDVGKEVELTVNGQVHKVRLIGVDHDDLVDGGKAHCTFEFANLLSDSNGYSLASLWYAKEGESSKNYNYLNSNLRKALDGSGEGEIRWYEKEAKVASTTYTISVYDMLPADLKSNIKMAKKYIAKDTEYKVVDYNARIFALTHNEITASGDAYAKEEGTTYQYYKEHDYYSRIKYQVKWHEGAVDYSTRITDLKGGYVGYNYAGYNEARRKNTGGIYWLASPSTFHDNYAWYIDDTGGIGGYSVYIGAYALAPAFCI